MTKDEKIYRVARAAHNCFVTYCKGIGDFSVKEWEDAEGWQRADTVRLVESVLAGNHSPQTEHDIWLIGKEEKGYVYGAEKNDDLEKGPLTNPNIMPYESLPQESRAKDELLVVVARGAAAYYGL